jgi:tetratricopeptide (TPR) repeat protein
LARLHAAGWTGLRTDAYNLRVSRQDAVWRLTIVVPHLPTPLRRRAVASWMQRSSVRSDLRAAAWFFHDLVTGRVPGDVLSERALFEKIRNKAPLLPALGDTSAQAVLTRLLADETSDDLPADAASLAESVLPVVADRESWAARVASLPRVGTVVTRRDYSRMIELAEAERSTSAYPDNPQLRLALAAARHQRACAAYAERDFKSALRDLNKAIALDPWTRYLVTRGVVREAVGDRPGARADYDRAVTEARASGRPWAEDPIAAWEDFEEGAFEGARALYARGVARLKAMDIDGACADLDEALAVTLALRKDGSNGLRVPAGEDLASLESLLLRARLPALAARIRGGGGDVTTWWVRVSSLHALGRLDEARAEGKRMLELFADDPRCEEWYRQLSGARG